MLTISLASPLRRHSWHRGPAPTYQPRFSDTEIAQARALVDRRRAPRVICREGVAISLSTVQRILARHHLKPWRYVSYRPLPGKPSTCETEDALS